MPRETRWRRGGGASVPELPEWALVILITLALAALAGAITLHLW